MLVTFVIAFEVPQDRRQIVETRRQTDLTYFLCSFLSFSAHPCLYQFFHESIRERLFCREVDGAFRYIEAPELVLEHFDYGKTHREQTAVL